MTVTAVHPSSVVRRPGRAAPLLTLAASGAALALSLAAPPRADAAAEEYAAKAGAAAAQIQVDASQAPRGIMSAHLTLPVTAGPLTLVYPKWLPGRHSPAGGEGFATTDSPRGGPLQCATIPVPSMRRSPGRELET